MNDQNTTLSQIRELITDFSAARGWTRGENPKDLAMALSIEAAELMEIFQWLHSDQASSIREDKSEFTHLKEELADVFWYVVRICEHFSIDLSEAVADKAEKNAVKYPL